MSAQLPLSNAMIMNHKKRQSDNYCWICHQIIGKSSDKQCCLSCIRAYHYTCLPNDYASNCFVCPECALIVNVEEWPTNYGVMRYLNGRMDDLVNLLIYAIETIKAGDSHKLFHNAVDIERYPDYCDRVANPMDLSVIEANVRKRVYASTISFLADIKWIHHNCVVYSSFSDNTKASEKLVSKAMEECDEIDTCADCYKHYFELSPDSYFREPCLKPHGIVWAKVYGYPYWPAKVIKYDPIVDKVMVTFFGTHDKSGISLKHCYLISESRPSDASAMEFKENSALSGALKELNVHIVRVKQQFPNLFRYWPMKTPFTVEHVYLSN